MKVLDVPSSALLVNNAVIMNFINKQIWPLARSLAACVGPCATIDRLLPDNTLGGWDCFLARATRKQSFLISLTSVLMTGIVLCCLGRREVGGLVILVCEGHGVIGSAKTVEAGMDETNISASLQRHRHTLYSMSL